MMDGVPPKPHPADAKAWGGTGRSLPSISPRKGAVRMVFDNSDRPDTTDAAGGTPPIQPSPQRGTTYGRLVVLGMADLDIVERRSYLLKGLISPAEISIWVGPPKCGKSFLLLYIAYMLSLGRSVFGRRVKLTRVLYVAAEGEAGIGNRIQALRDRHGPSDNFNWIAQPADLLHQEGHLDDLIAAAEGCAAQLIIVDTLSRAMAGGDESSSVDMGMFVMNMTKIRHETKAHVAIVHHGTKGSGWTNPRGHGSLEGADDALIEVTKAEDGSRQAKVIHAKDDPDGMVFPFLLDKVELDTDEDGDPITTLVVVETAERVLPERSPLLTNNEKIALSCLDQAMKANSTLATVGDNHEERPVVRESDWRRWFYSEGKPGEPQETKRQAFKRVVASLLVKQQIATRDDLIWRRDHWG
jgi:hypothetical protein